MKGKILDFSVNTNSGIISGNDNKRYNFGGAEWKSSISPCVGQMVDFEIDEDNAKAIYLDGNGEKNSTYAVLSLVLSIVGMFTYGLTSILGIVFGHIAKSKINKNPSLYEGRGLATAGLILGYVVIAGWVVFWIFVGGVVAAAVSGGI